LTKIATTRKSTRMSVFVWRELHACGVLVVVSKSCCRNQNDHLLCILAQLHLFYDPATSSFSTLNKLKDVSEYFTTNSDHPPLHGPKNYTERSLIPMTEVPAH